MMRRMRRFSPRSINTSAPLARASLRLTVLAAAMLALPVGTLSAQSMRSGEASITSRADVRLRIESGPGTSRGKLGRLGGAIGGSIAGVRACYAKTVEERPTIEGTLRLFVEVKPRGASVSARSDSLGDAALTACAVKAVKNASYRDISPPASAIAVLTFQNAAASGVARTERRSARERNVRVNKRPDGSLVAAGGTPGREVRFLVTAPPTSSSNAVQGVHAAVRGAIPLLLDCRRKATRRGHSAKGTAEVKLRITRTGKATPKLVNTTMESPLGPPCITRALRRTQFEPSAQGNIRLDVTFAEDPAAAKSR